MAQEIIRNHVMQLFRFREQHIQEGEQLFTAKQPNVGFVFTDKKTVPILSPECSEQFFEKRLRLLRCGGPAWQRSLKNFGATAK